MSALSKNRMQRMITVIAYFNNKYDYDNNKFMDISVDTLLDVLNYRRIDEEELSNINFIYSTISNFKKLGITEEITNIIFEIILEMKEIKNINENKGIEDFIKVLQSAIDTLEI